MKRIDWFEVLISTTLIGGALILLAYCFGLVATPEYTP